MRSIRRYSRLLVISAAYALVAATGCGSDGGDGDDASPPAEAGAGGDAGSPNTDEPEAGESSTDGGRGEGTAGTDATGGTDEVTGGTSNGSGGTPTPIGGETNGEAGANDGPPVSAPEFEGVDLEGVVLEPSPGCEGGFDPETGTVELAVDPATNTLLIDASNGHLRANGSGCTDVDGVAVPVGDVVRVNVTGTSGEDTVVLDLLEGTFGSSLTESADSIQVALEGGNDRFILRGTRGDDQVSCSGEALDLGGGQGAVTLTGVEGITASLGPGSDTFRGYVNATPCSLELLVYGGDDADVLQGGSANDELNGGVGSDEFEMGPKSDGADVVNGGEGADLVSYALRNQRLTVALCSSTDASGCASANCECDSTNGEVDEGDTLVNIEDADGGDAADSITGDAFGNVLSGKGGADTIDGLGGADQIYGDSGDDLVNGGADDDILIGGAGLNTIDGGTGDDICFTTSRDKPLLNCETKISQ